MVDSVGGRIEGKTCVRRDKKGTRLGNKNSSGYRQTFDVSTRETTVSVNRTQEKWRRGRVIYLGGRWFYDLGLGPYLETGKGVRD